MAHGAFQTQGRSNGFLPTKDITPLPNGLRNRTHETNGSRAQINTHRGLVSCLRSVLPTVTWTKGIPFAPSISRSQDSLRPYLEDRTSLYITHIILWNFRYKPFMRYIRDCMQQKCWKARIIPSFQALNTSTNQCIYVLPCSMMDSSGLSFFWGVFGSKNYNNTSLEISVLGSISRISRIG